MSTELEADWPADLVWVANVVAAGAEETCELDAATDETAEELASTTGAATEDDAGVALLTATDSADNVC